MYFDSHAHLTEDCFTQDFDSIVENMKAASVTGMMEIGFDLPSSEKAVQLAERFSWVHAAVGSHPDDAAQVDEARIAVYRELCKDPRVKAIGEIGLDYHYEDPPRDVQQRAFRLQMALAQELSMPVVIHERKAHEDGLRIIDEFPDVKGVFHCFSGSYEMAKELIKRGWCIGFTGVVTFKNAHKAVEVAQNIPLDRILIETDCPYMAPEPFRGRRCDPSLVPYVAKKIADLRGIPAEEVARADPSRAGRLRSIPAGTWPRAGPLRRRSRSARRSGRSRRGYCRRDRRSCRRCRGPYRDSFHASQAPRRAHSPRRRRSRRPRAFRCRRS